MAKRREELNNGTLSLIRHHKCRTVEYAVIPDFYLLYSFQARLIKEILSDQLFLDYLRLEFSPFSNETENLENFRNASAMAGAIIGDGDRNVVPVIGLNRSLNQSQARQLTE